MKTGSLHYFLNCMLLLVPIMAWNIAFTSKLPRMYSAELFERNIPVFITTGENILRLLVFLLPLLMPLQAETMIQKFGLGLYLLGSIIYVSSWLVQMYFPQSPWSLSAFGSLAPAYTPLIWLVGISMIGSTLYFPSPYRPWMYIMLSILFIGFHLSHAILAYQHSLS